MLLAGGEGKRLGALTKKMAKPAVHFGGKYRIIDFALSNCTNSSIDTVGVLTQYEPLALNTHLGIGVPWDLDRRDGGLTCLPPYIEKKGGSWYQGTANAILQNIPYIEQQNPEHVLILSGDHIYQMNYNLMLDEHIDSEADVTISVIDVPLDEASRFGIMETNERNEITQFVEKPAEPKSTLASMGIYIFKWSTLKALLLSDAKKKQSTHDFGKDIIPAMLQEKQKVMAYRFKGYWRDVGTIQSYWQANMDVVGQQPIFDLHNRKWKMYSVSHYRPPHYVATGAEINTSIIDEGCEIAGHIEQCVLFHNVKIGTNSHINKSVIMPNVSIGENVQLSHVIVNESTAIPDFFELKGTPQDIQIIDEEAIEYYLQLKDLVSNG